MHSHSCRPVDFPGLETGRSDLALQLAVGQLTILTAVCSHNHHPAYGSGRLVDLPWPALSQTRLWSLILGVAVFYRWVNKLRPVRQPWRASGFLALLTVGIATISEVTIRGAAPIAKLCICLTCCLDG